MATAAEREKARRLEVERAYVKPEPKHDWADAAATDRPSRTIDLIVAAAQAKGWIVEEKTRYDWHPPAWVTDPDGGPVLYKAKHRVQYHLFVHHPLQSNALSGLAGMDLLMIDGRKALLKLGWAGRDTWERTDMAITGIAKLIREEGLQA